MGASHDDDITAATQRAASALAEVRHQRQLVAQLRQQDARLYLPAAEAKLGALREELRLARVQLHSYLEAAGHQVSRDLLGLAE